MSNNKEVLPLHSLEKLRVQFPPEFQNIVATLIAAFEPISLELITHFSHNEDGKSWGNKVAVTLEQVAAVIRIFQEAEKKFGVTLLQIGPIQGGEEIAESAHSTMGYKFVPEVQEFVKNRYPQLHADVHGQLASRMWFDLFGEELGSEDEDDIQDTVESLLPPGEQIGKLADDAAAEVKRLANG